MIVGTPRQRAQSGHPSRAAHRARRGIADVVVRAGDMRHALATRKVRIEWRH